MNNGQPPYGDPNTWGQQGNPVNPGQYPPVQQNPYAQQGYYQQPGQQTWQPQPQPGYGQQVQQPQQQGYSQPFAPVQTYQQQAHPQQPAYAQQTWQPYGTAPQQGAGQQVVYPEMQQPAPQQPLYGQQMYQQPYQQAYPQQPQQPQQVYSQQPQQAYPQQTQQPQPNYPQFNQQGQQVQQGYSGYYSEPAQKKFDIPLDVVGKVILFGVLPLLFILMMIFSAAALKWIFLAAALGGIALMWLKDIVSPNMRLTMSLVLGVMAVVALVGALSGAPADKQNTPANPGQNNQSNQVNQLNQNGNYAGNQQQNVTTPTVVATATPSPEDKADGAVEQLMSFFYFWSVGNDESMLDLTAPSWRASVDNPASALFVLLLNRTPQDDYEVTNATGTDNDALRTLTVKVTIDKNDGRETMDRYAFKVIMKKEDGIWYVDPQSLASNEKETATETAAAANTTPTQPPLYTGTPTTILYYNANGGSRYHLDPDCPDVGKKYKPMSQFWFVDLDQAPYNELIPCNRCGAPIPDD